MTQRMERTPHTPNTVWEGTPHPHPRTCGKPLLDQRHAVPGARQLHLHPRQGAALAAELGGHGAGFAGPPQRLPAGREPPAAWGGQPRGWGGGRYEETPPHCVSSLFSPGVSPPCPGAPGMSSSFQSSRFSSRFLPGKGIGIRFSGAQIRFPPGSGSPFRSPFPRAQDPLFNPLFWGSESPFPRAQDPLFPELKSIFPVVQNPLFPALRIPFFGGSEFPFPRLRIPFSGGSEYPFPKLRISFSRH